MTKTRVSHKTLVLLQQLVEREIERSFTGRCDIPVPEASWIEWLDAYVELRGPELRREQAALDESLLDDQTDDSGATPYGVMSYVLKQRDAERAKRRKAP